MFNQEHMEDFVTARPTTPNLDTPEDRKINQQLDEVEQRLIAQYTGKQRVSEDHVRSTVRTVRARFADARVRTYLPILVERAARSQLAA